MNSLNALRKLVHEGKLPADGGDENPEQEAEPERSASRYIGDVLDTLHASGHLSAEDVDEAASVIANRAEDGHEAVVHELVKKGFIPGQKLMNGGQRRLKERVKRAMRESIKRGVAWELTETVAMRRKMTERVRGLAERLDAEVRDAIQNVLQKEGYSPLDVDHLMSGVKGRIRGVANVMATESNRRSVRPMRS